MNWPYKISTDLTHEQKHERRILLDRYGVYAQLSALVPILVYQLYRIGVWVYSERQRAKVQYEAVPSSPRLKSRAKSRVGVVARQWRSTVWWLESDVLEGWGQRGHWIAWVGWMSWLLFLCVHKTGEDYFHLTKRFGVIAASQFPLHYMLSLKSRFSPLGFIFSSSHEQLNPWHRLQGRVIYTLLACHAGFYINFFVRANLLLFRLKDPIVIIGITAFTLLTIIISSSLAIVRRWSYRVFFILHLLIGIALMPLLFFHHSALRVYVVEALTLFLIDIVVRRLDTTTTFAMITPMPNTTLLKIDLPIPAQKLARFQKAPGQHVYLSIPASSRPKERNPLLYEFLFNPFTIASISTPPSRTPYITLVLRHLHGPTTQALQTLASLSKANPPLSIEGPLGSSSKLTNLAAKYDRFLLVAGGVGGTYILPFYHFLTQELEKEDKSKDRVSMVWSMRSVNEASWALEQSPSPVEDENTRFFVTGNERQAFGQPIPEDGSVELSDLTSSSPSNPPAAMLVSKAAKSRPDLQSIVDETFRLGNEERVAVLVCGPKDMARELRGYVGIWVARGREVLWHDEGFGW